MISVEKFVTFYETKTSIDFKNYYPLIKLKLNSEQLAFLEKYPPRSGNELIKNSKKYDDLKKLNTDRQEDQENEDFRCDNSLFSSTINHTEMSNLVLEEEDGNSSEINWHSANDQLDSDLSEQNVQMEEDQSTISEQTDQNVPNDPMTSAVQVYAPNPEQYLPASLLVTEANSMPAHQTEQIIQTLNPINRNLLAVPPSTIMSSTTRCDPGQVNVFTRNISYIHQTITTSSPVSIPLVHQEQTLRRKKHPFNAENQATMMSHLSKEIQIGSSRKTPPPNKRTHHSSTPNNTRNSRSDNEVIDYLKDKEHEERMRKQREAKKTKNRLVGQKSTLSSGSATTSNNRKNMSLPSSSSNRKNSSLPSSSNSRKNSTLPSSSNNRSK